MELFVDEGIHSLLLVAYPVVGDGVRRLGGVGCFHVGIPLGVLWVVERDAYKGRVVGFCPSVRFPVFHPLKGGGWNGQMFHRQVEQVEQVEQPHSPRPL